MTDRDPLLDRLAAFEPMTLPVLSFYLNTSSDQHTICITRRNSSTRLNRQVDTLIVSASSDEVREDTDADASVLEGADVAHRGGTPLSEQVVRLARTTGAHMSFIEDPALLADVGGVGATPRYRL